MMNIFGAHVIRGYTAITTLRQTFKDGFGHGYLVYLFKVENARGQRDLNGKGLTS